MDAASKALLVLEHHGDPPHCLFCGATPDRLHDIGCLMDLALAERNFALSTDRDAARARLKFASGSTLPAPPSTRDLDELESLRGDPRKPSDAQ